MKKIESADELLKHFESIGIQKSMSKIMIPEIGTFKIFHQDNEVSDCKLEPQEDGIAISEDEKFEPWNKVLMKIEQGISRPSFETWFKSTSAM